ncbi:undecaprenyldiphospho-muramoylpentapeptide beta-N-acetylglucosaminyltransferase [Desulfobulbus sp. US2]|uniref:UDP-N-acetylglucosamine--N-acetylmuramyl-(pentapeptide) pyrophosphoryl-undecaprenol N-acetylglucosamine transferase n=1 Tax=Candidatus Electrothrix communis TaxID=1859133 RepID=A0A444J9S0_9BACT|nr:undecaprenyldiphospho-muramoylpentapeptide beta-N-acetylglucosaminyltransferase [Desulfobulbus sp. US4]MCW5207084.1 undecaprenyldiphospho-muramoylpentapeptide beta-N-acetylglucosaminyltransferase [Desulfobulbus sp. US2]RWX49836.1 UDP-N-acetylglucosamine-N-acetylmuramylpentapeptide N-acetylglucosamine transferase [Candidatus Electrothrix communis]WLE95703.1 MAG: undecaprenyldiphospho-muramoylpentapeptide beta-N-acetylglucosaminyltransferase [Candidatus Electrothrix communis]
MRIIITGGGTGGHLFPGIALATALQQKYPGCEIMFVGTQRQLDKKTLAGFNFQQESIACMGLKGMGLKHRIKSLLSLPVAVLESWKIIQRFQPDLVFGVGGYVTGPVLLAARLRSVPTCIHEQNSIPGLANRMISHFVSRIFVSIPGEYPFPEQKTVVSGNPVRQEILAAAECRQQQAGSGKNDSGEADSPMTLLIMGGSLGAHRINMLMLDVAAQLDDQQKKAVQLIHQTGTADEETVRDGYAVAGVKAEVRAFFTDMASLYSQADLVLARAGATSLAELSVMGLPAVLIPYPYAADDHQAKNAEYYVAGGGAVMYRESELDADLLGKILSQLLGDIDKLKQMALAMKNMGQPEATQRILDSCMDLIDNSMVIKR